MSTCRSVMVYRHVLGVMVLSLLSLLSVTANAAAYQNYDIFKGDIDGDGDADYYFHSERIFLLVGGEVPLYVDGPPTYALLFDSATQQYSAPTPFSLTAAQITSMGLTAAVANSDYYVVPDLNGDGREDLMIQGQSAALESLVLLANYNQLPTVAPIPANGVLTLATGTITVADFNGDGFVDLYIAQATNNQIAYADGTGTVQNLAPASTPTLDQGNPVTPIQGGSVVAATQGSPNVSAQGAAQYHINVKLPPALGNMKPALSLNYNSQRGTGEMGMGWSLSGIPVIHRCAPSFATEGYRGAVPQSQSERLCLDGQKLVAINRSVPATDTEYWLAGTEYRTERESFLKIVSYGIEGNGPQYFKAWTRSGNVLTFGFTADARLILPTHLNVDTWGLNQNTDPYGNSYNVIYGGDRTIGEFYIDYMDYAPGVAVRFTYSDRSANENIYRADQPRGYLAGGLMSTTKLLDKVTTTINVVDPANASDGTPVREYRLTYERGENTDRYRLANLTECGYDISGTQATCARPTQFDWQAGGQGFEAPSTLAITGMDASANPIVVDLDNDGYQDFVFVKNGTWHIARGSASGYNVSDTTITAGAGFPGSAQPLRIDQRYALLVADRHDYEVAPQPILLSAYYTVWHIVVFDVDNPTNSQVHATFDPTSIPGFYGTHDPYLHASAIPGDFNGDGLEDFYLSHGSYDGFHSQYIRNGATWSNTSSNFTSKTLSLTTPDGTQVGINGGTLTDFDDDGFYDVIARRTYAALSDMPARVLLKSTGTLLEVNGDWILPRGDSENTYKPYRYVFKVSKESGGFFNRTKIKWTIDIQGAELYQSLRNGFFADLNGDGLDDYVVRLTDAGSSEGTWRFYLNKGGTFGSEIDTGLSTGTYVNQLSFLMDYDRDGTLDFVAQRPDGSAWRVLLNDPMETTPGSGVYQPNLTVVDVDPFQGEFNGLLNFDPINDEVPISTDINHDGIPDMLYASAGVWKVMYGKSQQPDLLIRATDGFGALVEFDYSALVGTHTNGDPVYTPENNGNVFPQIDETAGLTVVKAMRLSNAVGTDVNAFNAQYFQYEGAKIDLQGRGFLGFSQTTVTDQRTNIETQTTYHQTFPYTGLVSHVLVRKDGGTGSVLQETTPTYAVKSLNLGLTQFPYLDTSITRRYDWNVIAGQLHTWHQVNNTVDDWGNLTAQTQQGGVDTNGGIAPVTEYVVDRVNNVSNDTVQWLLGFVDKSTVTYHGFNGELDKTLVTDYSPQPGTVDVASKTDFAGSPIWLTSTYQRDPVGNVTQVSATGGDLDATTAPSRNLFTHSDYLNNLYPRQSHNALNHLTQLSYDMRFGLVSTLTDPNSLVTQNQYNPFGQVIKNTQADGSYMAVNYAYCDEVGVNCPASAVYRITVEQLHTTLIGFQGAPRQHHYYDSLSRLVRSETMDFANTGQLIRVDREYDLQGQLKKVTEPHAEGETSLATCEIDKRCTTFVYDLLGRQEHLLSPDGGEVTTTYSSDALYSAYVHTQVKVIAPDTTVSYQSTHRYVDSQGKLVHVEDANAIPINYLHDAQGFVREVTINNDPDTQLTRTYDIAGHQVTLQDPDVGAVNFYYDGFGQLRKEVQAQSTANERSTRINYDLLGRSASQTRAEGTNIWVYDTQKKGQLSSRTGVDFSESYLYDNLSRLQHVDTNLTGSSLRSYRISYGYDDFSRPTTQSYPSGLTVRHQYQTTGYLGHLTNEASQALFWQITGTNSRGQVTEQTLGNGLMTKTTFDPTTGRLATIKTGDGTTHTLQQLTYGFDSLGNLRNRASQRQNSSGINEEDLSEQFAYDSLNQVLSAFTTGLSGGNRTLSYTYNPLGNLTYRSDVGNYAYPQTGNAGVHAVTSAGSKSFGYDVYGNMTQNGATNLTYTSFDKPALIQSGTLTATFKYGPDNARFYQNTNGKETYYLAGGQYEEIIEGGILTQKSYVGGVLLHSKTGTTEQVRYLHRDHLGSVEAISDEAGNRVERFAFAPFGQRRMEDWSDGTTFSGTTTEGFTGHEHLDDFVLIHMGGRVYDPVIGRFLSADPFVQAPGNTLSYNRYSYVFNNPLSYTDPSGYQGNPLDGNSGDSSFGDSSGGGSIGDLGFFQDFFGNNLGGEIDRYHTAIASNKVATDFRNTNHISNSARMAINGSPFFGPVRPEFNTGFDPLAAGIALGAPLVIACIVGEPCGYLLGLGMFAESGNPVDLVGGVLKGTAGIGAGGKGGQLTANACGMACGQRLLTEQGISVFQSNLTKGFYKGLTPESLAANLNRHQSGWQGFMADLTQKDIVGLFTTRGKYIARIGGNPGHFVTVESVSNGVVKYWDPSGGIIRSTSISEFTNMATGVVFR